MIYIIISVVILLSLIGVETLLDVFESAIPVKYNNHLINAYFVTDVMQILAILNLIFSVIIIGVMKLFEILPCIYELVYSSR